MKGVLDLDKAKTYGVCLWQLTEKQWYPEQFAYWQICRTVHKKNKFWQNYTCLLKLPAQPVEIFHRTHLKLVWYTINKNHNPTRPERLFCTFADDTFFIAHASSHTPSKQLTYKGWNLNNRYLFLKIGSFTETKIYRVLNEALSRLATAPVTRLWCCQIAVKKLF